ncbi:MAG: hypothetical protein Crog4KO_33660 [Crocinitomicaceae bacterium]
MAVAPNRYKIGLVLLLVVSSCAKKLQPSIEAKGVSINTNNSYVDALSVDSILFASGSQLWLLNGSIVNDGIQYDFQSVYTSSPLERGVQPVQIQAPDCFRLSENDSVVSILTHEAAQWMLSWRVNDQFLMIRTVLTSEH